MKYSLCMLCFFFTTSALSSEKDVVPIHEGEKAPFTGVLMDPKTAAKIVADKEFQDSKCELLVENERNKQLSLCDVEKTVSETLLKSDLESKKILSSLQEKEIVRLNKLLERAPPELTPVWFTAGTLTGIVLSVTIFYAAVQIANDSGQD